MEKLLDLSGSKLLLEGTKEEQEKWSKKISESVEQLLPDKNERKTIYKKRHDFYTGEQGDYSNIQGIVRDTKQKKGHTNQVTNYAGKTTVKIAFGIANNPPKFTVVPNSLDELETVRTQAVEDYIDSVFDHRKNRFWKKTYRRAAFFQSEFGDAAVKIYPEFDKKEICIVGHEDMASLLVGWNGNPGEYDFVVAEMDLTADSIFEKYGIKVDQKQLGVIQKEEAKADSNNWNNTAWGTKKNNQGLPDTPSGKTLIPKVKVQEYDSEDIYAIKIQGKLVQLVYKDDIKYPKVKFWTIIPNIPNPPSPWSIADIDYLMSIQLEINDNDNRSADHLRVGNVQRYVAYNMADFDPESIKTTSGQVIFVNDNDGKSRFEPLQTNINNFPDDQYHNRKMQQMYDMGLPKVNYGASGADSGRSKAIDYQSSIDLTQFKRDAWELALQEMCEKIQIFGHFLYGDEFDWFTDENGEFIVRNIEFDWTDILPVSQSDKIVNIANKFNMIGISLKQAYRELGYRNPDALIDELKRELEDPQLMILRSKAWQLSQGLLQANAQAAIAAQSNGEMGQTGQTGEMGGTAGMTGMGGMGGSSPTLTPEQNSGSARPMAAKGGTTAYSSAAGAIDKARQNQNAQG